MTNIRLANENDLIGKGYVHYHAWNETYTGLINQEYLDKRSLETCVEVALKYPDQTFVAEANGEIVGFASYSKYRDEDLINAGEISAIYVLKNYQRKSLGRNLLNACTEKLSDYDLIVFWVLDLNKDAINFYRHCGFKEDGKIKTVKLSEITSINEIRMIKCIN